MLYAGALRMHISLESERPLCPSRDSGGRTIRSVAERVGSVLKPPGKTGSSRSCSYIALDDGAGVDMRGVLSYFLLAETP